MHTKRQTRRLLKTGAVIATLALALTGCAQGSDSDNPPVSPSDIDAALEKGGEITVWTWDPAMEPVVENFEAKYPEVTVNLVNAGTGPVEYTALQNAILAGAGTPDVVSIEYYALPQFTLAESLADLTAYGAADVKSKFSPSAWESVQSGDAVYALPYDFGPMAMFYNQSIFDQHGIEVPTTWDEFIAAAAALHAADPQVYITNDTGDPGVMTSLMWQAGGHPFGVDGSAVTIDLSDPETVKFAEMWQQLLDQQLLAPITTWSDEWYKALAGGNVAALLTGGWMPSLLQSGVPAGAGQWRVAPLPQWAAGDEVSAASGGSSLAIPELSTQKELAYGFTRYVASEEGATTRIDAGTFPALQEVLSSSDFRDKTSDYFGGQKINEVLADSADQIAPGWQYLPYQVYANTIFGDTVGKSFNSSTPLTTTLLDWQAELIRYGETQGFTVNGAAG